MFMLALETALRSIRKTPGVSILVMMAIALGVGVTMPMVVLYKNISQNPLPGQSDKIYTILIDNWFLDVPFWQNAPEMPPEIMTGRDARAMMASDIPTGTAVGYNVIIPVRSADGDARIKPFFSEIRVTTPDFFRMFRVPMRYGNAWDEETGQAGANVAVLGPIANQRLFGGGNTVGREFKIANEIYQVVGILDSWNFAPRLYSISTNARVEGIFVPLSDFRRSHLKPGRAATVDTETPENFDQVYINSETIFAEVWVELPTPEKVEAFRDYLDSYVLEQKALGRFQRPINNRLYSGTEWLEVSPVSRGSKSLYRAFIIVAAFFLVVCLFNLISLLLAKFMSVMPEACTIRALGATRTDIFLRYLLEVGVLGLLGGLLSLYIARLALRAMVWVYVNNLSPEYKEVQGLGESPYAQFDTTLFAITFTLAIAASLIAAVIPAWRACRVPPTDYLKVN